MRAAGVDLEQLGRDRVAHAKEIAAVLSRNATEAQALELRGTPGILVGRLLVDGITDMAGMQQLVAAERRTP